MAKREIEGFLDILDPEVEGLVDVDAGASASGTSFCGFSLADGEPSPFDTHGRDRQHRSTSASGIAGTVGRYAQTSYRDKVVACHMRRVRAVSEIGGLSIATVRATASVLCKVVEAPSLRRSHKMGIVEGAVFVASCQCSSPRTTREVALMFEVGNQVVVKGAQKVQNALACMSSSVLYEGSPEAYVPRFIASIMDYSLEYKALANVERTSITRAKTLSSALVDESPSTIAAVAIASASGYMSTKHVVNISDASGVKANALKKCLKLVASMRCEADDASSDGS
jgi:transcription initiation factor TFIIIB Brf1 subunit/transcription initiation factor TFIIB